MKSKIAAILAIALGCSLANAQSEERCEQLSRRAKTSGQTLLIVAFEGLWQYQDGPVQALYQYQATKTGYLPQLQGWGDGITAGLLSPLVRKYGDKFDVAVFASGDGSIGTTCATTWLRGAPGRKVMLMGHSAGGPTAGDVAEALVSEGLKVDSVFTFDSVGFGGGRPSSGVAFWGNFYERGGGIPGDTMSSANIDDNVSREAGHMNIPGAPDVIKAVSARVAADITGG
jgi:hypothetical protein